MRKTSSLDALFTAPRQGILAATLMEPGRWWYLSDLARHLGVHHATLQRELARLSKAEILLSLRDGNRSYFRANPDSPIFPDLRAMLAKTAGLVIVLRDALRPFEKQIECAFVYGSVARASEASESDVDLMVIGELTLKELAPVLRVAEKTLRRPVNPSLYRASEFARRASSDSPFIAEVLEKEKLFVIGNEGDLERMARSRAPVRPQARARRNRRAASSG
jgi:predicted nucleotidyltransferase